MKPIVLPDGNVIETKGLKRLIEIGKLSKKKGPLWKHKDLFRILNKIDIWISAYDKVRSSTGALTPGVNQETAEGFSIKKLEIIKNLVLQEKYEFSSVKEIHIPKSNGKKRPLGIPVFSDKVVQEVIRLILDAIYEPNFHENSFGFRTNRGPHDALSYIEENFRWCSYVIEGDIKEAYPSISHSILIRILQESISDERFINLIRKLLKTGVLRNKQIIKSYFGTPQGSVVSPILANVYFNKLDNEVNKISEEVFLPKSNRRNSIYKNLSYKISRKFDELHTLQDKHSLTYRTLIKDIKKLQEERRSVPSLINKGVRVRYVRFADDWVIGIEGPKKIASEVLDRVQSFLKTELALTLSPNKTKITCLHRGTVSFLGYNIFLPRNRPITKVKGITRRGNSMLRFEPQMDKILPRLCNRGFITHLKQGYRPVSKKDITHLEDHVIVGYFSSVWLGIYNYYSGSTNRSRLLYLQLLLLRSCAMTLGHRHRISSKKAFTKHGNNLLVTVTRMENDIPITSVNVSFPLLRIGKIESKKWNTNTSFRDPLSIKINKVSRSNLLKNCALCASKLDIEMHHVKHVRKRGSKYIGFHKQMSLINRKQIPVCRECHNLIHEGYYDGISLKKVRTT